MAFTCEYCNKQYKQLVSLKEHMDSSHVGLRYKCPACSILFTLPRKLKIHYETKHSSVLPCMYCNMKYENINALLGKEHIGICLKVLSTQNSTELDHVSIEDNYIIPEDDFVPLLDEYPEELEYEISTYWRLIRTCKSVSDVLDHSYNYRWSSGNYLQMVSDIYNTRCSQAF